MSKIADRQRSLAPGKGFPMKAPVGGDRRIEQARKLVDGRQAPAHTTTCLRQQALRTGDVPPAMAHGRSLPYESRLTVEHGLAVPVGQYDEPGRGTQLLVPRGCCVLRPVRGGMRVSS